MKSHKVCILSILASITVFATIYILCLTSTFLSGISSLRCPQSVIGTFVSSFQVFVKKDLPKKIYLRYSRTNIITQKCQITPSVNKNILRRVSKRFFTHKLARFCKMQLKLICFYTDFKKKLDHFSQ